MRALLQRVAQARVEVAGATIGQTGPGLLILVCAIQGDTGGKRQKSWRPKSTNCAFSATLRAK